MYINDMPNCLESCTARVYADDTSLTLSRAQFHDVEGLMNTDLRHVLTLIVYKLSLNILKSEFMILVSRQKIAPLEVAVDLSVNGISLSRV